MILFKICSKNKATKVKYPYNYLIELDGRCNTSYLSMDYKVYLEIILSTNVPTKHHFFLGSKVKRKNMHSEFDAWQYSLFAEKQGISSLVSGSES